MGHPLRAILARRLKFTPELLANVRQRFEGSAEPLSAMAADLGCSIETVRNIAKREGWTRYQPPPRDLSPSARLRARAEKMVEQGDATLSLPPRSGGEGRPSELAKQATADGVGGVDGVQEPPTPDPSPPFAARMGGGEVNAARLSQETPPHPISSLRSELDLSPQAGRGGSSCASYATALPHGGGEEPATPWPASPPRLGDTAEQLHGELQGLLAEVSATRARMKRAGYGKHDLRDVAQVIVNLTTTLRTLQPLLCAAAPTGPADDYDDMPADLDAFRDELARRIRIFVAGRRARSGLDGIAADNADAAQP